MQNEFDVNIGKRERHSASDVLHRFSCPRLISAELTWLKVESSTYFPRERQVPMAICTEKRLCSGFSPNRRSRHAGWPRAHLIVLLSSNCSVDGPTSFIAQAVVASSQGHQLTDPGQYQSVVVCHFSSNPGDASLGFGITHWPRGEENLHLFAEARYLFLKTPSITETNGQGTNRVADCNRRISVVTDIAKQLSAIVQSQRAEARQKRKSGF